MCSSDLKLCCPAMEVSRDALLDRIRAVEKQLEEGLPERPARDRAYGGERGGPPQAEAAKPKLPEALSEDVKTVAQNFRTIVNDISPMLKTYLKKAKLSAGEGNRLLIVCPDEMGASVVGTKEHKAEIEAQIQEKIGKQVEIEVRQVEAGRRFEDQYADLENLQELIHMEITVED